VIEKSGNTHSFGDIKLGVGKETAKQFLRDIPRFLKRWTKLCVKKLKPGKFCRLKHRKKKRKARNNPLFLPLGFAAAKIILQKKI